MEALRDGTSPAPTAACRRCAGTLGVSQRPEVARYQSWDALFSRAQANRLIGRACPPAGTPDAWRERALERVDDGSLVGDLGVRVFDDGRQAEVRFTIASAPAAPGLMRSKSRNLDLLLVTQGRGASEPTATRRTLAARLLQRLGSSRRAACCLDLVGRRVGGDRRPSSTRCSAREWLAAAASRGAVPVARADPASATRALSRRRHVRHADRLRHVACTELEQDRAALRLDRLGALEALGGGLGAGQAVRGIGEHVQLGGREHLQVAAEREGVIAASSCHPSRWGASPFAGTHWG